MPQAVAVRASTLPSRISAEGSHLLDFFTNKFDREGSELTIAAEDAPSNAVIGRMAARAVYLDDRLGPMGEAEAFKHYAVLKNVLKSRKRSDGEAEMATDTYVHVLAPLPAFAVVQACEDVLSGAVGDREWLPEPPVIAGRAREIAREWHEERCRIKAVLGAKVRPPRASDEERRAAAEAVRAMIHGWGTVPNGKSRGGMSSEELEDARRTAAGNGNAMLSDPLAALSPEELAKIPNAPKKPEAA